MRDPTIAVPHTLSALGLRLPAAPLGPGQPTVVVVFMYSLPVARAEQHAAQRVRSWYRATRPPRAGSDSKVAVIAPQRALRPIAAAATDADLLAAMLFAVGQPVRRTDLLAASGWTQARLQSAVDSLMAAPPRGQQVMLDGDRLELVAEPTASSLVQRLFRHLERGNKVLEPLDLPETVWLVLAIIILDQPITRAEITARRMADSDRQVQVLLRHRLIREEPRAPVPGRGIPLITTDLVPVSTRPEAPRAPTALSFNRLRRYPHPSMQERECRGNG